MGIAPFMLANAVNCIVSQRLVRKLCPDCRQAAPATEAERAELGLSDDKTVTLYHAAACRSCRKTGYQGRTAIYEVLPMTSAVRKLIGRTSEEIHEQAVHDGMVPLRQDGLRVVLAGITSLEEVRRVAGDGESEHSA
jgi:type II secretory ATPase GspE/PulE/Tfp pilus assembly ATPase PilB-like protein